MRRNSRRRLAAIALLAGWAGAAPAQELAETGAMVREEVCEALRAAPTPEQPVLSLSSLPGWKPEAFARQTAEDVGEFYVLRTLYGAPEESRRQFVLPVITIGDPPDSNARTWRLRLDANGSLAGGEAGIFDGFALKVQFDDQAAPWSAAPSAGAYVDGRDGATGVARLIGLAGLPELRDRLEAALTPDWGPLSRYAMVIDGGGACRKLPPPPPPAPVADGAVPDAVALSVTPDTGAGTTDIVVFLPPRLVFGDADRQVAVTLEWGSAGERREGQIDLRPVLDAFDGSAGRDVFARFAFHIDMGIPAGAIGPSDDPSLTVRFGALNGIQGPEQIRIASPLPVFSDLPAEGGARDGLLFMGTRETWAWLGDEGPDIAVLDPAPAASPTAAPRPATSPTATPPAAPSDVPPAAPDAAPTPPPPPSALPTPVPDPLPVAEPTPVPTPIPTPVPTPAEPPFEQLRFRYRMTLYDGRPAAPDFVLARLLGDCRLTVSDDALEVPLRPEPDFETQSLTLPTRRFPLTRAETVALLKRLASAAEARIAEPGLIGPIALADAPARRCASAGASLTPVAISRVGDTVEVVLEAPPADPLFSFLVAPRGNDRVEGASEAAASVIETRFLSFAWQGVSAQYQERDRQQPFSGAAVFMIDAVEGRDLYAAAPAIDRLRDGGPYVGKPTDLRPFDEARITQLSEGLLGSFGAGYRRWKYDALAAAINNLRGSSAGDFSGLSGIAPDMLVLVRFSDSVANACHNNERLLLDASVGRQGRPLSVVQIVGVPERSASYPAEAVDVPASEAALLARCPELQAPARALPVAAEDIAAVLAAPRIQTWVVSLGDLGASGRTYQAMAGQIGHLLRQVR